MKQNFRKHLRPLAVLAAAALLLTGCKGVTEEEKTARENGIALLESGDYEGALDQFEALIQDADRVTDFEVDILKYRAEAEYGLKDYEAAAHTYDILSQIDKERAEYGYFAALSLAKAGDPAGAWEKLEQGRALDGDGTGLRRCHDGCGRGVPGFRRSGTGRRRLYGADPVGEGRYLCI